MRWYIILLGEDQGRPWVLAESPDENWAKDQAFVFNGTVVFSRAEAMLDPDFREVLEAWDRGDDSAYGAWESLEQAEILADNAAIEAQKEGLIEPPDGPDDLFDYDALMQSVQASIIGKHLGDPVTEEVAEEYAKFYRLLIESHARLGKERGQQLARLLVRDVKLAAEASGGRIP